MITLSDQVKYQGFGFTDPKVAVGTGQQYATMNALINDLAPKGQLAVNMRVLDLDADKIWKITYEEGWGYTLAQGNLTGEEIAILLNAIPDINDMVLSNKINYNQWFTVKGKIDNMDAIIDGKQNKFKQRRMVFGGATSEYFLIENFASPIFSLALNRVPLVGIEANDFSGSALVYDYIYKFIAADTRITLSASLGKFKSEDIIDIVYQ